ncbi:MAG TPA: efflux RND transporter periplasmic adaptor subunit, partial [Thermoanaerobaculia bacterium]|nr:efflux RND transporter periplasmic adaptor subunit [Thermoanaerobaculia bacterium]
EVDVNEAYIQRVTAGQPVEARLDAYPDWTIPAHVIAIVPAADRQKATVRVRVGIDGADPRILPDMGVKVAFIGGQPQGAAGAPRAAVGVPKAALRRDGERDVVLVASAGRVERRAVEVGAALGERVEILSGLAAGERVIVEGPAGLADGDAIEEVRR